MSSYTNYTYDMPHNAPTIQNILSTASHKQPTSSPQQRMIQILGIFIVYRVFSAMHCNRHVPCFVNSGIHLHHFQPMFTFRLQVIACALQLRIHQHARLSHQCNDDDGVVMNGLARKRIALPGIADGLTHTNRCLYHLTTLTQRWYVNIYFTHFETV